MTQPDVSAYIDAVAARAVGEDAAAPVPSPVVAAAIGPLPARTREMLDRLAEGHRHFQMGTTARGARFGSVRRLIYTALRPLTREQITYNNAVLVTLDELTEHVLQMRSQFEQRITASQVLLASTEMLLEETHGEVRQLQATVADLEARRQSPPGRPPG